jgi:hypothetical protein
MSISASIPMLGMAVTETINPEFSDTSAKNRDILINGVRRAAKTLVSATSGQPAVMQAAFAKALAAGVATIDLRALPGLLAGITQDGNGLKVQHYVFENPATNANPITIAKGAANGYALFGATGLIELAPGDLIEADVPESRPDVAGGAKTIDLSGTGTQAINVHLVLG